MSDWDDASDDPFVEDPEALRRAEAEVARSSDTGPTGATTDDQWVPVAQQFGESFSGGLQTIAMELEATGIPFGWDPYDPRDSPTFLPPIMGMQGRTFTLLVPESQLARARAVASELRPEGVTPLWEVEDLAAGDELTGESSVDDFGFADDGPQPDTGVSGPGLSDNAHLSALATGGAPDRSGGLGIGAVLGVLLGVVGGILAIVVAILVLRS